MTTTQSETRILGQEEIEKTFVKRKGRFLLIFPITWWEEVKTEHTGNDIYIETNHLIRKIYLNGKEI